jgi:dGTPase
MDWQLKAINVTRTREDALLASYAMRSSDSAGRKYAEPDHAYRGPYVRDRDRIVHSAAYRRLAHKTQVFTGEMGDYHRTRLTHTLEVASIARTIARVLAINEDLVEALALAHDLGHPPFGHAGEDLLDSCLAEEGGFNHNAQGLRIVELLETRYPEFPGLNLTRELLDGQAHRVKKGSQQAPLLEVQVVDAADAIAYAAHDADDAVEIGRLPLEELRSVAMWKAAADEVQKRYASLDGIGLRRAVVRQLIDLLVSDLVNATFERLASGRIESVAQVRAAGVLVSSSPEVSKSKAELESFLLERVYRHPGLLATRLEGQRILRELFTAFVREPERLPSRFRERAKMDGLPRSVADYLAGMTDRFAWETHGRLPVSAPSGLVHRPLSVKM